MALNKEKWIQHSDGLFYCKKVNRYGNVLVVEFSPFERYRILKVIPYVKLPEELQKQISAD